MMSVPRLMFGTISAALHLFHILLDCVDAVHLAEYPVGAGLYREVDKFAEAFEVADGFHQLARDVDRVAGHEADSFHSVDLVELVEQVVEEAVPFGLVFAVAVDVLAKEGNLFIPLGARSAALFNDVLGAQQYGTL